MRKYPLSLFIMGTLLELIKAWYILALILLLIILRAFYSKIPVFILVALFAVWFALAVFRQIRNRKILINTDSTDEETNDLIDKMFKDNGRGYKNVVDAVNEVIEKNRDNSES